MRHMRLFLTAALGLALGGCPHTNPIECVDNTSCDLSPGGVCTVAASGNQWCAYPDLTCPGGMRYSDLHVGDGLSGACVNAEVDAGGAQGRERVVVGRLELRPHRLRRPELVAVEEHAQHGGHVPVVFGEGRREAFDQCGRRHVRDEVLREQTLTVVAPIWPNESN